MRRRSHRDQLGGRPCTCEMGNLYRFCEPIVLLSLARLGTAHGYQIASEAEQFAVTHAGLDAPAIYRALRRLENSGCLTSHWDTQGAGPARRLYTLTPRGYEHLSEWVEVIDGITSALTRVAQEAHRALASRGKVPSRPASRSSS